MSEFRMEYGEFDKIMGLYIKQIEEQKKTSGAKEEGAIDSVWKEITT